MQIRPIINYPQYNRINFKSSQVNREPLGFDDEESRSVRDYLREDIARNYWHSIGRMSPKELNETINSLASKPKIDNNKLAQMDLWNLIEFDKGCFRGEHLDGRKEKLKQLKEAGLEQVIDLMGGEFYPKDCKEIGLKYTRMPIKETFWDSADITRTDEEFEELAQFKYRYYKGEDLEKSIAWAKEKFNKENREFLDTFVNFINAMKEENLYLTCGCGIFRSDIALLLNSYFNPKPKGRFIEADEMQLKGMRELYKRLTSEDKEKMGYTRKFDQQLREKLQLKNDPQN